MKSTSLSQFDEHADKSNKMSSDLQGNDERSSNGDLDSREKSGMLIIPATVQIAPIIFAAFVARALNCSGLHIA